jgi:nucleolar protein 53
MRLQKRALLERKHRKALLASLAPSSITTTLRSLRQKQEHAAAQRALRKAAEAKELREKGLVGKKIGKHRVAAGKLDVQTGEELSESLRGLKVSGESGSAQTRC